MSRSAVAITLSEAERRELEGLARRRKTAQGLARRPTGSRTRPLWSGWGRTRTRSASGAGALPSAVWMGSTTNRARSAMKRLRRSSHAPWKGRRPTAPIGACARWPRAVRLRAVYDPSHLAGLRPAAASQRETFKLSIRPAALWRRSATSSASISARRSARWCSASTRRARLQALDRSQSAAAHVAGTDRAAHPRLHAPRHHHALRGAGHRHRRDHRAVLCAPPQPRGPQVPAHSRSPGARRPRRPSGDGHLRNPQDP